MTIRRTLPIVRIAAAVCLLAALGCQKSVDDRIADAKLQQEIGSWEESIETLQGVLDDQPDHPEANLLLGAAQVRRGQAALAIWPLEVAARSPEYADQADLGLGAAFIRLEQTDAAIQAADRVLARNPSDPNIRAGALRLRSTANVQARNWDGALEDVDRMLADDKDNVDALALMAQALLGAERIDEAEAVMRQIWDDPTYGRIGAGAQAGIALVKLHAYHRDDMPSAEKQIEELLERFPQNRQVLNFTVGFLGQHNRQARASELLKAALERDPGDMELRGNLADQLIAENRADEAEELLIEATDLFDSPHAWMTMAQFYRQRERHDEALAAFERSLELLPGRTDAIRFRHGDMLADSGQLDRAAAVAAELEGDAYRNVLMGRVAYLQGDFDKSLEYFDAGLHEWPNNSGARLLAGRAAMAKGDLGRGIEELREATRTGLDDTDAPLELSLLYLKLGRPASAAGVVGQLLTRIESHNSPRAISALQILARAHWESGSKEAAHKAVELLEDIPGTEAEVALQRARFAADDEGPGAAADVLAKSPLDWTDPQSEPMLRPFGDWLVQAGRGQEALRRVDAAAAANPEMAAYQDMRARILVNLGRGNEAIVSLERAIELDPEYAPAYEAKGVILLSAGQAEQAREQFDRAAQLDSANAAYPYLSAKVALGAGRNDEAERHLRSALQRDPVHAHASNDLAWILAERGEELEYALQLATRASSAEPSPAVLDTLGWVQYRRGDHAAAVSTFERALALDEDSGSIAYHLGLSLVGAGDRDRAADVFRQALAGGPFPEADEARAQLAQLDAGAS